MKKLLLLFMLFGCFPVWASAQEKPHKFFDKTNLVAFSALSSLRVIDLHSTWRFRRRGFDELILTNSFVDNKPLFVGMSAGMVGANIGLAYIFHRTGHHKLERIFSYTNIGIVSFAVIHNYRL